jgi:hypothetical protein
MKKTCQIIFPTYQIIPLVWSVHNRNARQGKVILALQMTNRLALFTFGGSFAKANALLARPARLRHHKSLLLETMFPHLQFSLGFAGAVARPRLEN